MDAKSYTDEGLQALKRNLKDTRDERQWRRIVNRLIKTIEEMKDASQIVESSGPRVRRTG